MKKPTPEEFVKVCMELQSDPKFKEAIMVMVRKLLEAMDIDMDAMKVGDVKEIEHKIGAFYLAGFFKGKWDFDEKDIDFLRNVKDSMLEN